MGAAFYNEAGWPEVYGEWSDVEASVALTDFLNDENSIAFMAKENEKSIGMIGGYLHPFWLKKSQTMITEFYWYVMPEQRKGVGSLLKNALDDEAISRGIKVSAMSSIEKLPSLDNLYERQGYKLYEKTFMKRF